MFKSRPRDTAFQAVRAVSGVQKSLKQEFFNSDIVSTG
jgi:hypothetical protein